MLYIYDMICTYKFEYYALIMCVFLIPRLSQKTLFMQNVYNY